jgi:hypothetical protein
MEGSKDDYLSGGGDHYDGEVTHDDGNPDRSRRDNEVDWRERDQQGYYDEDRREKMQDSKNDDGNDPAENKGNNLYITNLSFEVSSKIYPMVEFELAVHWVIIEKSSQHLILILHQICHDKN